MWKITEYNGKVAIGLPWRVDYSRPVETRSFRVCDVAIERWEQLLGKPVKFAGNHGVVYNDRCQPVRLDTTSWELVIEERPVKRPRQRKDRPAWRWKHGRWVSY